MQSIAFSITHLTNTVKCGTWCGYLQSKVDYDYKILPGGINDQQLVEEHTDVFQKIASKTEKFLCVLLTELQC
jgi:hypothetical protein